MTQVITGYEAEIIQWVREHYQELGYDQIIKENERSVPDFIMLRDGKEVRVEVELSSRDFVYHKHNPSKVDEVLCIVNNRELSVKTIELKQLRFWYQLEPPTLLEFFKNYNGGILIDKQRQTLYHFKEEWFYANELPFNYALCMYCDKPIPPWSRFCFMCGQEYEKDAQPGPFTLPEEYKQCVQCLFPLPLKAHFCVICGVKVD